MNKSFKLCLIISLFFACFAPIDALSYTDYKSVAKASNVIYLDENDENSPTLTIEYTVYTQPTDKDDVYTSYALETVAYFSNEGDYATVEHIAYNADIQFEATEMNTIRLIEEKNIFFAFFSGIDRIDKAKLLESEKHRAKWELKRSFFAGTRFFDDSYTMKNVSYFSIHANSDVELFIEVKAEFHDGETKELSIPVHYKVVEY